MRSLGWWSGASSPFAQPSDAAKSTATSGLCRSLSKLHTAADCIILSTGVCRTPPVRGKGGAHLSRSRCGTHTDLSSAHDADTGALLKEVVRVHAEPVPFPVNLEQQRKLAKDLLRAARDGDAAALARIRAVRPDAAARRDRSSLPMRSWPSPARPASSRGRSSSPISRSATSRRSATRCVHGDIVGACNGSSHRHTSGNGSTIRCSTSASVPRTSPRRTQRC